MHNLRMRHYYTIVGSILVLLAWLATDPDAGLITQLPFGASTLAMIVILSKSVLYVALLHYSRKAILDYLDLQKVFQKAVMEPIGSGLALVGVGLIMIAISVVIMAAVSG